MDEKENLIDKKCQSCGNPKSLMQYNKAYLCSYCLSLDNRGVARPNSNFMSRIKQNGISRSYRS